jgi:hypothetical protein
MTAETKDAPLVACAITPARDRLNEAIVALQVNPKNFSHHHQNVLRELDRDATRF